MRGMTMSTRIQSMRMGLGILVAGYWLALFVATHVPHVPAAFAMPGADKWEHLGAYATLAFLLAGRQCVCHRVDWKSLCRIALGVALYGVFDELTQIPVGRHADVADWLADVFGCLFGLALFAIVRIVFNNCRKRRQASFPTS